MIASKKGIALLEYWLHVLTNMGVRPTTADDWADVFARQFAKPQFSSDDDMPNFLAQVLHESGMLERLEENLRYSAPRLMAVWPRRFPTPASTRGCVNCPDGLAERVYGGRMGNCNPGDGARFRGRGLIQVTGRDNYTLLETITGLPLVAHPEMLTEPEYALQCSVAWWEAEVPDTALNSVERVTRHVNGGAAGLEHRRRLTDLAYAVLSEAE